MSPGFVGERVAVAAVVHLKKIKNSVFLIFRTRAELHPQNRSTLRCRRAGWVADYRMQRS
jgi:hypothetical protein